MVTRFEIATRRGLRDARGEHAAAQVRDFLHLNVEAVRTREVYKVEGELSAEEAERVLGELTDPVLHRGAIGRVDDGPFDAAVTVAYKPGVTDPVGKSAKVAVEDTIGRPLGGDATVFTSRVYLFEGLDREGAERAARELLHNPLIESAVVETPADWAASEPDLSVPRVEAHERPPVATVDLSGSDDQLLDISRKGLLALELKEMQAIRDWFQGEGLSEARRAAGLGAAPTDVELECLAQTWSEHCKHKIFNATITYLEDGYRDSIPSLFKRYIRGATEAIDEKLKATPEGSWLKSVFHDNAGVVAFDEVQHLVFKVETHNSPSALDPYGGAITGIVGVNRDPFGTGRGADLLANVWGYCFASPYWEGELPKGLLHPKRIRDGVHHGVIDGGNQSGVPYGRGWELFDSRFLGKPLVFCGTVGALPVTIDGTPGEEKGARPGDLIVMAGGRIGADGIHGATFSSAALDESAPVQAVQIGDPITQKILFDFLLEARERGLYSAMTDNGAGGLSSSIGEMAETPGGAELDLSKAPLKYAGLAPWEVLVSEAQERMSLAVPPEKIDEFLALAKDRTVEASVLGSFTDTGVFHVKWGDETVAWLDMGFLHGGDPDLDLTARWTPPELSEPEGPRPEDLNEALRGVLSRFEICSNEDKARHYDHEVKGLSVIKPWVGVNQDVRAEATVFLGRHGSLRGFVLSEAVNPFLSDLDAGAMAWQVVDEAVRKQLCAGARLDRIALLDNFCWPDPVQSERTPDGEFKLAQLVRACGALHDACVAYGTPLISGKDSMKNDSTMGGVKISVPPTLLCSAIGQIDDVNESITLDFKAAGDLVYLLGETADETGGSAYYRWLGESFHGLKPALGEPAPHVGSKLPMLDTSRTLPLYRAFESAVRAGLVRSAAAPAKGGLAVSLALQAVAGGLGAELELDGCEDLAALPADSALFAESNGRFVVTVKPGDAGAFEAALKGQPCRRIGTVSDSPRLRASLGGRALLDSDLDSLREAWRSPLAQA